MNETEERLRQVDDAAKSATARAETVERELRAQVAKLEQDLMASEMNCVTVREQFSVAQSGLSSLQVRHEEVCVLRSSGF